MLFSCFDLVHNAKVLLIATICTHSKHEEVPLTQWPHMIGPIIGGVIGGKIMISSFPDDTKRQPQRLD